MFDLPPAFAHEEIPRACVVHTIQTYQLPPELFIGYMGQERGRVGMANRNANGTYDYGPAQVNSAWLKTLNPYGIAAEDLRWNPCTNVWVSGWIMRRCLDKFDDFWQAVGCYHVGENPRKPSHFRRMEEYARLVYKRSQQYSPGFQRWLTAPASEVTLTAR